MDPFVMIRNIINVAKALLGLSSTLEKARRERRDGMATLFQRISDCLKSVAAEIEKGNNAPDLCRQMETYAKHLPEAIGKEVGSDRAQELSEQLHSASRVERLAYEVNRVK